MYDAIVIGAGAAGCTAARKLAEQGKKDAAVLTSSIGELKAVGSGSDIAADSAGVVLLGGRIEATVTALRLSKNTMRTVRQNLLWAVLYNVICIPAAAFGIVNPSMAAAAMTLSSNGVLLNSLRLQKAGEKKNERRNGAD